ncbi:MAG: hypothetical protein H7Y06_01410 [Opitutaceae bacterium]|nr:hypothetical protein [Opitutaceae bacterium]
MKRTTLRILRLCCPVLLACAGCSETVPKTTLTVKPAPATDVGRVQAWSDAERVAASDDGRVTVIGSGESMRPIYGENTVLVISKIDYADLKPGMQVAYVNQTGHRVVHVLLEADARGWRVQGLNNANEDKERVTRYNLIGVVYASFATDEELK